MKTRIYQSGHNSVNKTNRPSDTPCEIYQMDKNTPRLKMRRAKHYFFRNPYPDISFTRCPKCEEKTKIRKFCILIHIDPKYIFSINKSCRYCPKCDLIIAKQAELESLLAAICESYAPDTINNEYFVFGTMDRKDWKSAQTGKIHLHESLNRSYPFKDVWNFEVRPAGWYPDTQVSR